MFMGNRTTGNTRNAPHYTRTRVTTTLSGEYKKAQLSLTNRATPDEHKALDGATRSSKTFDDIFNHLVKIREYDGQADRHRLMVSIPRLRTAQRRAVKATEREMTAFDLHVFQSQQFTTSLECSNHEMKFDPKIQYCCSFWFFFKMIIILWLLSSGWEIKFLFDVRLLLRIKINQSVHRYMVYIARIASRCE